MEGGPMHSPSMSSLRYAAPVMLAALAACADAPTATDAASAASTIAESRGSADRVRCAPDNGGITLPPGFCAAVVADLIVDGRPAAARHMAVTPAGDLFVAINAPGNRQPSTGIIAL